MAPQGSDELQQAEEALARGEAQTAFQRLRPVVNFPGRLESAPRWQAAVGLFARIAAALEQPQLVAIARAAADQPDDPRALYELGYQLLEQGLHGFAATVLARADAAAPGQEPIVTELVFALEHVWHNGEACRRLRASGLVESSWLCRYLLAFHSVLSGDLEAARALLPSLHSDVAENQEMVSRIAGMLRRADALRGVSALDDKDLRGWHFVLNGALLLHRSPHGFDEGMRGRYAYTQDGAQRCHEGLRRLALALEALALRPPRVYLLADRESAVLGHAAARLLEVPAVPWTHDASGAGAPQEPGLLVVYDLAGLSRPTLASVSAHRPGQVLFAHATCWTADPPFAADLTTYLYQTNVSPWGSQLRVDPQTRAVSRTEPRAEPVEALAEEVVSARLPDEALEPADVDALRRLAVAAAQVADDGPGALRAAGPRRRQWAGSPVKSSFFG
jgi:hypothetical protein